MLKSMSGSVLTHAQITTTTARAKSLRPYLERLITKAIQANNAATESARVAAIRLIDSRLGSQDALHLLLNVTARIMAERPGGYTRILKAGIRNGDAAEMSVIQLVSHGSPLDSILPDEYRQGNVTDKERYEYLKSYCLSRTSPSRSIVGAWVRYPFPTIEAKMVGKSERSIVTTIELPAAHEWNVSAWPKHQGEHVPLELYVRFYLSSDDYGKSTVLVRQGHDSAHCRLFPPSRDATSVALVVLPPDSHTGWGNDGFGSIRISLEHVFTNGRPTQLLAAIFGPYEQLRTIRWAADPRAQMETHSAQD